MAAQTQITQQDPFMWQRVLNGPLPRDKRSGLLSGKEQTLNF